MGRFFTSTQIYNSEHFDREKFKDYFCEKMKNDGYEVCEADNADLSYVLVFADNCKWVTISSEAYGQGNRTAQADTARIAKMLNTTCINITVIDSDCAVLDLYDEHGKKADFFMLGRADDYFGDDIPQPSEKLWSKFLSNNSTWVQLTEICDSNEVFVEDGLSKLSGIFGIDSENILFEYDYAGDSSNDVYYLSFRKAVSKKEKKPALNTLFQQIWGVQLEPLGFKKPKLRMPYYVRIVNDEIIHIVGIHDMKSHLVPFGGIATVYRKELCLDHSFRQNERWLRGIMYFYLTWHISDKPLNQQIRSGFRYNQNVESQTLSKAVHDALNESMTWVLPVLDNVKTLKDVADYNEHIFKDYIHIDSVPLQESNFASYMDTAVKFLFDDPLLDLEQRYSHFVELVEEENSRSNRSQEIVEKNRALSEKILKDSRERLQMFLEDEEMHNQTLEELERRKMNNLEMLKKYNVY